MNQPLTDQQLDEIATALERAAALAETHWTPDPNGPGICSLLAMAASTDGPDETDLWDAVVTHLREEMTVAWERQPGRTRSQVATMLRAAGAGHGTPTAAPAVPVVAPVTEDGDAS